MGDYIVKAMAADGQIRAYAATTRLLTELARWRHNTSPVATAALGRSLTAAAMMGSMLKSDDERLTIRINGNGPMRGLVVCADNKANVKGYTFVPDVMLPATDKGKLDVAGALGIGTLSVTRDIGMGEPFTGTCILITSEIAEDLTYYFATSEQTPSAVALGVLMNKNNTVKAAGGFIIQLMPGVSDETIAALEERINGIDSISRMLDAGLTPEGILEQLLGDMGLTFMDQVPCQFKCDCSHDRMLETIAGLNEGDLQEWIDKGLDTEVICEYCNGGYIFPAKELKAAIEKRKAEAAAAEDAPLN
ncbi:MAG: Hsp33 family molecular chaperone HslO [Firmicutes bacterium]|nr:Hsp33 family molecular chaperone HslO [Bacillota bacterium]MBQ3112660.1 Hsp33 family molecular chaperone HslO [Bacillota bacterium]MBR6824142.1 Hsp33 family molecular chaperone HslO [Bacillota bacterium]MBR7114119.1 Hsp33 family molecular chaperone HslO [Bacillota bacterium]